MTLTLIPHTTYRTMPWKNGGGETTEIAVSPANASLDGFDWRISMARVAVDGPFSLFPGVDRSLCVLSGNGIELTTGDSTTVLTTHTPPYDFPADQPVDARLLNGPITDLNVMVRRGRCKAQVTKTVASAAMTLDFAAPIQLVMAQGASFTVATATERLTAQDGDTVCIEGVAGEAILTPQTLITLFVISLFPA